MAAEGTSRSRRSTTQRSQTGRRTQRAKSEAEEPKTEQTEQAGKPEPEGRTATLTLPFVTAELRNFRAPQINLPRLPAPPVPRVSRHDVAMAGRAAASILPPPRQLAYYGGLGALAAFEVIEWPVAAAIGVGTMVVQNSRRESGRQQPSGEAAATE